MVWVVDPVRRSVTIHRPNAGPTILTEDDTLNEEELLGGFSLPVRNVFPAE